MEISVIVCTYNRSTRLRKTLASFPKLVFDRPLWELIIVDNNSKDDTKQICAEFVQNCTLNARYIFEDKPGLSEARNRGVREAQGKIIVFVDDDVDIPSTYLLEVKKGFETFEPMCVGGRVLLDPSLEKPTWWDERCDGAAGKFDRGDSVIVAEPNDRELTGIGANMCFRRAALEKYGAFRTDLGRKGVALKTGEDAEMFRRLREHGERVLYVPTVLLYHSPSQERFSKRYLRRLYYGLGEWRFSNDSDFPECTVSILNVPRWRYRRLLMSCMRMLLSAAVGDRKEAFWQELILLNCVGYFVAAWNIRRLL